MRLAAIDLGSNTVKLTVADVEPSLAIEAVLERADVTRIGEGLDSDPQLRPAAVDRTLRILAEYTEQARDLGADRIGCVGTAGLRGARDAGDFLERVRAVTGLDVEIIDGLREATLAYRAPSSTFGPGPLIVVDVGGRSTEIITGFGPRIADRVSLEVGGVRLTERFLPTDPPTPTERRALRQHLESTLADAPTAPPDAVLVGVSGTILSLMGVHLDLDDMAEVVARAEREWLPADAVRGIVERLAALPAADRRRGSVIPEGRADVIVASATIVSAVCDHYRAPSLRVTHRGVRYGILAEMADEAGHSRR